MSRNLFISEDYERYAPLSDKTKPVLLFLKFLLFIFTQDATRGRGT